jgi:molybdopterin biosynthesis enzyme
MKNTVPVQEAVGMVLAHDITRIVPGQFKGPAFKKGHIIRPEDIPLMLDIGKEKILVLDLKNGFIHEDEAALRIAKAAAGPGLRLSEVSEGRVNLISEFSGLLKINTRALHQVNSLGDIVFATRHTNHRMDAGLPVAGTRIIPLVAEESLILAAEALCRDVFPLIQVKPFKPFRVGLIITGSEVFHGRIKDQFGPVVTKKFEDLGSRVVEQKLVSDDRSLTVAAIHSMVEKGAQIVVLTGGMSVDPDDQTPAAIRDSGAKVITYGAPTFPGAMFMLAYLGQVPVLGLPGCVMYNQTTIFDLMVPRILAGESITHEEVVALGHGGFCAGCTECRYPICGFGKV